MMSQNLSEFISNKKKIKKGLSWEKPGARGQLSKDTQ